MSWATLLVIAGGSFAFKAAGMFGVGRRMTGPRAIAIGALLPPAVLGALVATQTFATDNDLVIDARAAGVGAGALAVWRKAPFWVVIVVSATVTATIRALN